VPAVVNEFLRFETPTLYVARVPLEAADVLGTPVPAFTPVLVMLAAANRDPAVYAEPERFDIARQGEPAPLSFAVGLHHCLGAALARMETEVMLECLVRRWPRLRLAEPPSWWGTGPFRGLDRLLLRSS
jgi:cytochrome P450